MLRRASSILTFAAILVHTGSLDSRGSAIFVLDHAAVGGAEARLFDAAQQKFHEGQLLMLRGQMDDVLAGALGAAQNGVR